MDIKVVIIDDDSKIAEEAIVWELQDMFGEDNVVVIHKSNEGLEYIQSNLNQNMIVLLDIDFPKNEESGRQLLPQIVEMSKLIPVILWSGINENAEPFSDFINNGAFGFIGKMQTWEEAKPIIEKAKLFYESSLANSIEDWIIEKNGDKDKPVYFTADGKAYSLNEILFEVRKQTPLGISFSKKINKLTIDLLLRNKQKLDD